MPSLFQLALVPFAQILVHSDHPRGDLSQPCCSIKSITQYSLFSTLLLCTMELTFYGLFDFSCFVFFQCHGCSIKKLLPQVPFQSESILSPTQVLRARRCHTCSPSFLSSFKLPIHLCSFFYKSLCFFEAISIKLQHALQTLSCYYLLAPGSLPLTFMAGSSLRVKLYFTAITFLRDINIHVAMQFLDLFIYFP